MDVEPRTLESARQTQDECVTQSMTAVLRTDVTIYALTKGARLKR